MLAVMVAEVAAALGNISPLGVETAGPAMKGRIDQVGHIRVG